MTQDIQRLQTDKGNYMKTKTTKQTPLELGVLPGTLLTVVNEQQSELQKKVEFQRQLRVLILFSTPQERKGLVKYVRPTAEHRGCGIERVGEVLPDVMKDIWQRANLRAERCRV